MKTSIFIHFIGWLIFFAYRELEGLLSDVNDYQDNLLLLSFYTVHISVFYLFYSYIWPKYLPSKNWLQLTLVILVGLSTFVALRYFIEEFLYLHLLGFNNYGSPNPWFYVTDNISYSLPVVTASALIFLLNRNQETQQKQLVLQQEKTMAELGFLRSQANPHFLFNTLSFLHTEALMKDEALADSILKVSNILRYSVDSSKGEKRTFTQEVRLINDYIAIFKRRYENQCYIDFTSTIDHPEQLIEPLLLIPFIENAFKHGKFSDPQNPITIDLTLQQNELNLKVSNLIKRQIKDDSSGIGIENVQKRLALLYPDKHELIIQEEKEKFKVALSLQL